MNEEQTEGKKYYVILQWPNIYLWVLLGATLVSHFSTGYVYYVSTTLIYVSGIIWAYEEIVHGANLFRKLLGAVVMCSLVVGLFVVIRG
jgi:hypothetical protein